jgi:hypothetical protein
VRGRANPAGSARILIHGRVRYRVEDGTDKMAPRGEGRADGPAARGDGRSGPECEGVAHQRVFFFFFSISISIFSHFYI